MATDGMGVLSADKTTVSYSVCVNIEHIQDSHDGCPSLLADAEVTIGGVRVWAGLVNWITDDLRVNGVTLTGDTAAKQRAANEALTRWTDRW